MGILTADCVPILIYDKNLKIVSAVHAGWKGAYKNIIKKVVYFLIKEGSKTKDLVAVVGPSICQKSYEVKKDFFSWSIFEDIDVFRKDEDIVDPPRLSASNIERLFTNNGYDLRKVKETKLVNVGNQIPQLPTELKNIQSVKKKKRAIYQNCFTFIF